MVFTAFKDGSNTTNQLTDGTQGLPVTKESEVCDLLRRQVLGEVILVLFCSICSICTGL